MPDPQVLYIVTAVVVLGLVTWVIVVLARPEKRDEPRALPPDPAAEAPKLEVKINLPDRQKQRLHSHAEIHDEPSQAPPHASLPGETEEDDGPTGPNALILVTAVGRTDPGLKREHNEDAYAILEDHHLFVIADGMGRHAAGEVASRLCVDAISEAFRTGSFGPPRQPPLPRRAARLRGRDPAGQRAHSRCGAPRTRRTPGWGRPWSPRTSPPTTSASTSPTWATAAATASAKRKLTQLTTDHTLGAAGIQGKSGDGPEPRGRRRARTSRSTSSRVAIAGRHLPALLGRPEPHGRRRRDRVDALSTQDLEVANEDLIDKANRGGGRDNITAILVRVDDAKLSAPGAADERS